MRSEGYKKLLVMIKDPSRLDGTLAATKKTQRPSSGSTTATGKTTEGSLLPVNKVLCINAVSRYLYAHLNNKIDSEERLGSFRNNFLKQVIWNDVGDEKPFATPLDLPFYTLYDKHQMQHLGLPVEHLSRWISSFLSSIEETNQPVYPHDAIDILDSQNDLVGMRRVKFTDWEAFSLHLRQLDRLAKLRKHFEATLAELHSSNNPIRKFVCLDIEAYENSPRKLTEFGIAIFDRQKGILERHHIIIREHLKFRNRRFAPDAKHKFAFGQSMVKSTGEAMVFLESLLLSGDGNGAALLGHSLDSDIRFLRNAKLERGGRRVGATLLETIRKYDLQYLYRCRAASDRSSRLVDICKDLGIPAVMMHNAGNDAAQTLSAFLHLMNISQ